MPPFAIGPFAYRSKKEATEAVRDVLHRAERGARLDGADAELITALVHCHPDATGKIGSGLQGVEVRTIEYGQPGFWLLRTDGTSTEFSYRKALSAPSHRAEVLATMRRSISDQIAEFRQATFADTATIACPITGETLTRDHGQVDHHDPTFIELAHEFAELAGGWDRIELTSSDGLIGKEFRHDVVGQGWQQWHRQHATLRYIHPGANQRRGPA